MSQSSDISATKVRFHPTAYVSARERSQAVEGELRLDSTNSALKGTFWANVLYIADAFVRSSITLFLMPVLIALLGTEKYGLWISISTLTTYLTLSEAGLGQTVVNYVGKAYASGDLKRVGEIQATAHILYWMLVIPTVIVSVLVLSYLPVASWLLSDSDVHNGPLFVGCLMVSCIVSLARLPMLVFPGLLSGMRLLPTRVMCEIGATILAATATILVAWFEGGILGLALASNLVLLCTTAGMSLLSTYRRPWAKLRLSQFRPELLRPLASNSGYFFLISCATVLDRSVLSLMVAKFGSLALAPPIHFLLNIFRVAAWSIISAMPRAVQPYVLMWRTLDKQDTIATVTSLVTKFTSLAASLAVLAFVPFSETIVNYWLGPNSFPGMVPVFFIAGAFLIDAVFVTTVNLLMVMNEHRKLAFVLAGKSVAVIALSTIGGMCFADAIIGLAVGVFAASILGNIPMPWVASSGIALDRKYYIYHILARPLLSSMSLLIVSCACAELTNTTTKLVTVSAFMVLAMRISWMTILDSRERPICVDLWHRLRQGRTDNNRPKFSLLRRNTHA